MKVLEEKRKISTLVHSFDDAELTPNHEYQRGESWNSNQKATLIDSIFRGYPIPALFLFKKRKQGLSGESFKYEIVDGYQRLKAISDYTSGKFQLLEVGDKSKLRLPRAVKMRPAPWAGKSYEELSDTLRAQFDEQKILCFEIDSDAHEDEIRDLFIRLQSGTALTRQQVRDAWPSEVGPFLVRLAGKIDQRPRSGLFRWADGRGNGEESDERDEYVRDRQLAGQLLTIFLARARDPFAFPSVSANELDQLYHENTDWSPRSDLAARFEDVLGYANDFFLRLGQVENKSKFKSLDIKILAMYFQDISKSPLSKINDEFIEKTVQAFRKAREHYPTASRNKRSTSPQLLRDHYEWWRQHSPDGELIRQDSQRLFNESQKQDIRDRQKSICAICSKPVVDTDAEFDHYPIPFRDGGKTEIDNGRLVHISCHPRGRPKNT
jgi:hypothetical protein